MVRHHARKEGKSKYGLGRTLKVVLDLLTVKSGDHSRLVIHVMVDEGNFGRLGIIAEQLNINV